MFDFTQKKFFLNLQKYLKILNVIIITIIMMIIIIILSTTRRMLT